MQPSPGFLGTDTRALPVFSSLYKWGFYYMLSLLHAAEEWALPHPAFVQPNFNDPSVIVPFSPATAYLLPQPGQLL